MRTRGSRSREAHLLFTRRASKMGEERAVDVLRRPSDGTCKDLRKPAGEPSISRDSDTRRRASSEYAHVMGILEKLRPQPRWKHADPSVRAAAVYELGPEDGEALRALARSASPSSGPSS